MNNLAKPSSRYTPSYITISDCGNDIFLGRAGIFDVWLDKETISTPLVVVVGPKRSKMDRYNPHNYDIFHVEDGSLQRNEYEMDLNIPPFEMCLIYAMCAEHGVFVLEQEDVGD